jgi:hypothetical protein
LLYRELGGRTGTTNGTQMRSQLTGAFAATIGQVHQLAATTAV